MKKINLTYFEDLLDEEYGKPGTPERDAFEQRVVNDIIADEIKKRREALGLSQKELSEKTGLSQYIISKVEKNIDNVSFKYITKITHTLGLRFQLKMK